MIRVIQLLGEKNHYLERFLTLNEKQIIQLEAGHFDQIESFYNKREDILKIIKYIDAELHKSHMLHKDMIGGFTEDQRQAIRSCLSAKDAYVERIVDQDMQILALIDMAKSEIIKELRSVQKGRKAMTGYKSNAA